MSDLTPTRSAAIQLNDERRTMREGYAFLDEKCLLLAGEMLRAVKRQREIERELAPLQTAAGGALRAAVARHGLQGLEVVPPAQSAQTVQIERRALLGVPMLAAALAGPTPVAPPAVNPSPETRACRRAYAALLPKLTELAAISGNLARLYAEYRKTVRRVRALQDVLLPEVEQQLAAVEAGLEELEQDEAGFLRRAAQAAAR